MTPECSAVTSNKGKGKISFEIRTPKKNYVFGADTGEEVTSWTVAINATIRNLANADDGNDDSGGANGSPFASGMTSTQMIGSGIGGAEVGGPVGANAISITSAVKERADRERRASLILSPTGVSDALAANGGGAPGHNEPESSAPPALPTRPGPTVTATAATATADTAELPPAMPPRPPAERTSGDGGGGDSSGVAVVASHDHGYYDDGDNDGDNLRPAPVPIMASASDEGIDDDNDSLYTASVHWGGPLTMSDGEDSPPPPPFPERPAFVPGTLLVADAEEYDPYIVAAGDDEFGDGEW